MNTFNENDIVGNFERDWSGAIVDREYTLKKMKYRDKDGNYVERFRLWPNVPHFYSKAQEDFWKIYVEYLWNPEEYMPRYVMNVLQFQNFFPVKLGSFA